MTLIDLGSGPPVVVVPGIQGRWEWMEGGIRALAERCRVLTFSLCDEPGSGGSFDERRGFGCFVEQLREALDLAGLERAAICGVSYGGLIAAAFAARYPERVSALVLASPLPPSWTPNRRVRFFLRAPRLLSPLFWLGAPLRMYPEVAAAIPQWRDRLGTIAAELWRIARHPPSARLMSRRARLVARMEPVAFSRVSAPTLIVTGEASLDRVVPVSASREYASRIPHAQVATLERTGHLGVVTRPAVFADLVVSFVRAPHAGAQECRRAV